MDRNQTPVTTIANFLIATAVFAALVGVYQWAELIAIRTGGEAPLCNISEHLNCETVWGSPLAAWIHAHTALPFAAWGVAWGLVLLALGAWLHFAARRSAEVGVIVGALRWTALVGTVVVVALLSYSVYIKVFCLTCMLYYVFVAVAAFCVFRYLPATQWFSAKAIGAPLVATAVAFTALLYPGMRTPQHDLAAAILPAAPQAVDRGGLVEFLSSMPPDLQQLTSNYLAIFRSARKSERQTDAQRLLWGTPEAPVRIVDWIEIRCPHCKNLDTALERIREIAPPGSWSEEARNFPLDRECNPYVGRTDNSGVSCLAAKILICYAGTPEADTVRRRLFAEQERLTRERIWEIAADDGDARTKLEGCVKSTATATELRKDIDEAVKKYGIEGTPLVVINGRPAPAFPALIYALILAGGDANASGFAVLPPPQTETISP